MAGLAGTLAADLGFGDARASFHACCTNRLLAAAWEAIAAYSAVPCLNDEPGWLGVLA